MTAAAAEYSLRIEQGATLALSLVWADENGDPVDLTGATARAQVRAGARKGGRNYVSGAEPLASLTCAIPDPEEGRITVGLTAEETADLDFDGGVWDLEIELPGGTVRRILEGAAVLAQEVTK